MTGKWRIYLAAYLLVGVASAAPSANNITGFIVNGQNAREKQFPEVVSLKFNGNFHLCGGAIIDKHWVLTAAHCVEDVYPEELTVFAGTTDRFDHGTRRRVSKFIIHEKYRVVHGGSLTNDIALLKMDDALPLNNNIRQATLQKKATKAGDPVTVAGWGLTESADPNSKSRTLQWVKMTMISKEDCQAAYVDDTPIMDDQICTFSPKDNTGECKGDSGGPLFSGGWVVGLVSWSKKPCGTHPGVYASVAYHYDWIKKKTGLKHL